MGRMWKCRGRRGRDGSDRCAGRDLRGRVEKGFDLMVEDLFRRWLRAGEDGAVSFDVGGRRTFTGGPIEDFGGRNREY